MTSREQPHLHGSDAQATSEPHWRVYPVGVAGELVNAMINALLPFLLGIGGAFVLLLAVGLIGEEGLIDDPALADALDQFTRAAMAPVLFLGLGLGALTTVVSALREAITSRALVKAVRGGAPRAAVPQPSQLSLVATDRPYVGVYVVAIIVISVCLLFSLVMVFDANESEMYMVWGSFAATGGGVVLLLLVLAARPAHRRRRREIAAHWTEAHERAAWDRATSSRDDDAKSGLPPELDHKKRVASRCEYIGAVCFAVGFGLMQVWMLIAHPSASRGDVGPRAEYSDGFESVLGAGLWIFAGLMLAAVVLVVAAFVAESAVQRGEQRILREAMDTPGAPRPAVALLRKYAQRQPVVFAQGLAFIAALGMTIGWAVYSLGTGGMEEVSGIYRDADETFDILVPQAVSTLAGSVAVVVIAVVWNAVAAIRGHELRCQVVRRWPIKSGSQMVTVHGRP